jgi:hypothetical protein
VDYGLGGEWLGDKLVYQPFYSGYASLIDCKMQMPLGRISLIISKNKEKE